jgi:Domain of unknown function (DUF6894)
VAGQFSAVCDATPHDVTPGATAGWLGRIKDDDPHVTDLPNVAAALSYAQRRIGELQNESRYDHPGLMMIVKDEARQTVLSLPFLAGCA